MIPFDDDFEMTDTKKENLTFTLRWINTVASGLMVIIIGVWFAKADQRDSKIEDLSIRIAVQEEINRRQGNEITVNASTMEKIKDRVDEIYLSYRPKK